ADLAARGEGEKSVEQAALAATRAAAPQAVLDDGIPGARGHGHAETYRSASQLRPPVLLLQAVKPFRRGRFLADPAYARRREGARVRHGLEPSPNDSVRASHSPTRWRSGAPQAARPLTGHGLALPEGRCR